MNRVLIIGAVCLATALAFTAPASAASAPSFSINNILTATNTDLSAALADATAQKDAPAIQCYTAAQTYLAAHPFNLPPRPVGVISAFQSARDGVRNVESVANGGIPQELVMGCGALALSVQSDLGQAVGFLGIHF